MRVSQTQRSGGAGAARTSRKPGASGGAFSPSLAAAPRKASSVRGAASVGGVDLIVALQGVDDPTERRKRAIRDAGETLDVLDELKLGLLSGEVSPARLARLESLLRGIDLRARVELAKLAKAGVKSG